jgi:P27 family predicted phage terminase small subunit
MPMAPLTLSEFGKGHWERIWQTPWMLPDYDVAVVTRICEMYEDREAMRARLAQLGLTFASTTGVVHVNPIIDKLARLDAELRKLEAELGLTPASRARLGLTEVKRQSKLDALMRKQSVG